MLQLTHDEGELFGAYLPAPKIWAGRIEELKQIRNRIGHCRRPHDDDLDRLEQTLRDLERGAFRATSSFNDQALPNEHWSDVLVQDWVHKGHPYAHVIGHAARQYDADFRLTVSTRPWAQPPAPEDGKLGARAGRVWHACWYFRGGRFFDLERFWQEIETDKDLIVLVCADSASSLQVSFSALEDQQQISNAIARSFESALANVRRAHNDADPVTWARRFANVDPRVHAGTPWASVDPSMRGVSLFAA